MLTIYLLVAIGFKGGLELQHSGISGPVLPTIAAAVVMSLAVPLYSFLVLRLKLDGFNAAAIAAKYNLNHCQSAKLRITEGKSGYKGEETDRNIIQRVHDVT